MKRGVDLSFTLGLQVLRLPKSTGLVFKFHFRNTLRKFRGVTKYIAAALAIGWNLPAGYLFLMVEQNGERRITALTAARITAALQAHLRARGVPDHFTMQAFGVGGSLSKSLSDTAVDEIMKIGGWETERVTRYYIGVTTSTTVETAKGRRDGGSRRERDNSYAIAMDVPLSPVF